MVALLIGRDPRHSLGLLRTLIAAGVYGLSLIAQWHLVELDRANRVPALCLTVLVAVVVAGFYFALRSGMTRALRDPALTLPQILFAIVVVALAYVINPPVRGMLLMVVALVLVFSAFTLSPGRCRNLGWIAVAVFGVTMGLGARFDPQQFPPYIEAMHFAFAAVVLPTIALLAGQLSQMRLDAKRQRRELRFALSRLKQIATHDDLTGLPNRRHVQEWISQELARSDRAGTTLCVAVIDLDHFKCINDSLGHATGDAVLRTFAQQAQVVLRDADVLARWGGEEFLLVMPDTSIEEAKVALERFRNHLGTPAAWGELLHAAVTFSAGLTLGKPGQHFEYTVQRADTALYQAKRLGRNRVVIG